MSEPTTAAASPIPIAQSISPRVGVSNEGTPGIARLMVPKPVQRPTPTNTREPMPAASRPGARTTPISGPPMPMISSMRKAPTRGEPSSVLTAAKLPAAAITMVAWAGASRLASRTASTPIPPPMAISGASGPSTAPRQRVANEARMTPGSSIGWVAPDVLNPSAGLWPLVPGR